MLILITGLPGSGKTTVAKIFKEKGFEVIEMGNIARALAKKQKISVDEFAKLARKKYGRNFFAKKVVELIKKRKKEKRNFVISGLRNLEELQEFKKLDKNAKLIAVTAPKELRMKRLLARKRKTQKEIEARDKKEIALGMLKLMKNADFVIANTSTKKELEKDVEEILKVLRNE
jgi:dephospho-CoA kinase